MDISWKMADSTAKICWFGYKHSTLPQPTCCCRVIALSKDSFPNSTGLSLRLEFTLSGSTLNAWCWERTKCGDGLLSDGLKVFRWPSKWRVQGPLNDHTCKHERGYWDDFVRRWNVVWSGSLWHGNWMLSQNVSSWNVPFHLRTSKNQYGHLAFHG